MATGLITNSYLETINHLQIWKVPAKFEIADRAFVAEIIKSAGLANLIRIRPNSAGLVTILTFSVSSINLVIIRMKKEKF